MVIKHIYPVIVILFIHDSFEVPNNCLENLKFQMTACNIFDDNAWSQGKWHMPYFRIGWPVLYLLGFSFKKMKRVRMTFKIMFPQS